MKSIDNLAPKISVIITIENHRSEVVKCLNNVLNQTLKDTEILCVYDADTTNEILIVLKSFAEIYNRVKIIEKNNDSIIDIGLKYSSGDYLHFIEIDEGFSENMYENIYNSCKLEKLDVLLINYKFNENSDNPTIFNNGLDYIETKLNDYDFNYSRIINEIFKTSFNTYSAIYNKKLLMESDFRNAPSVEDPIFFLESIIHTNKIGINYDNAIFKNKSKNDPHNNNLKPVDNLEEIIELFKHYNIYEKFKNEILNLKMKTLINSYKNTDEENLEKYYFETKEYLQTPTLSKDDINGLTDENKVFYKSILETDTCLEFYLMNEIQHTETINKNIEKECESLKILNEKLSNQLNNINENNDYLKKESNKIKNEKLNIENEFKTLTDKFNKLINLNTKLYLENDMLKHKLNLTNIDYKNSNDKDSNDKKSSIHNFFKKINL